MSKRKKLEQMVLIGEIAKQAQVAPSTIRYYEKIGIIPLAHRVNGRRRYDLSIINRLKLIRSAQNVGWSLQEIRSLLLNTNDFSTITQNWKQNVPHKIRELDRVIEQTQKMKQTLSQSLDCACQDFESCVLIA